MSHKALWRIFQLASVYFNDTPNRKKNQTVFANIRRVATSADNTEASLITYT